MHHNKRNGLRTAVQVSLLTAVSAIWPAWAQEDTPDDLRALEYADTQGCFIVSGNAVRPVMPLLIVSNGVNGITHTQVITALDAALKRGCDIHQPDQLGLSPLNTAIVQADIELTRYLLEHGADPHSIIHSDRAALDGLDSFSLLDTLASRDPERKTTWQALREVLQSDHDTQPTEQ